MAIARSPCHGCARRQLVLRRGGLCLQTVSLPERQCTLPPIFRRALCCACVVAPAGASPCRRAPPGRLMISRTARGGHRRCHLRQNGVVAGIGNGRFDPDGSVTRADGRHPFNYAQQAISARADLGVPGCRQRVWLGAGCARVNKCIRSPARCAARRRFSTSGSASRPGRHDPRGLRRARGQRLILFSYIPGAMGRHAPASLFGCIGHLPYAEQKNVEFSKFAVDICARSFYTEPSIFHQNRSNIMNRNYYFAYAYYFTMTI